MANTKYLVIASVVVAALGVTPLIVSSSVDKALEQHKVLLEQNGFKHEALSKSGYFSTQRDFTLEVVDAAKVRDYLLDTLVAKNAQYKIFAQSMKEIDAKEMNQAFNGLKFKAQMNNSNLLPQESQVSLALAHLPHATQAELSNDKELSSVILPLLTRGVFALDMTLDSNQKFKTLKVRDIKESLKLKEGMLDIDTSNNTLALDEEKGVVKGNVGIAKQFIGVSGEGFTLKSELNDFAYRFNFKDDLNNQGALEVGKYHFALEEMGEKVDFSVANIKVNSSLEEAREQLWLKADYALKDVSFANGLEDFKLQTLLANLKLSGISSQKIKKLQKDYNALMLGVNGPSDEELIANFVGLINDGVKLDFGIALKELTGVLALQDISIDTTLEIAKNNYTDAQSPLAIVELLDISSKVKIHKNDRKTLEGLEVTIPEDFALGKAEGDFFVYDIAMKKGVITVNGKPIE
ncbi:MAG: hypothetical protein KBE79_01335 [Sulfurospirillum sp.]|nr:hypothetical protein [Sulfurospirillum sp.]